MKLSRPDIPTIKNRLEKALVIYSIFENGVIYILPTEILR